MVPVVRVSCKKRVKVLKLYYNTRSQIKHDLLKTSLGIARTCERTVYYGSTGCNKTEMVPITLFHQAMATDSILVAELSFPTNSVYSSGSQTFMVCGPLSLPLTNN